MMEKNRQKNRPSLHRVHPSQRAKDFSDRTVMAMLLAVVIVSIISLGIYLHSTNTVTIIRETTSASTTKAPVPSYGEVSIQILPRTTPTEGAAP